jgi:hypothetical protein
MKGAVAIFALGLSSLTLTGLRYGAATDHDEAFAERLVSQLAHHDFLLVGHERTPAFRILELRRLGCSETVRLGFAPDDGEAEHALSRLFPNGNRTAIPASSPLRRDWIAYSDGGVEQRCGDIHILLTSAGDPNG